MTGLALLGAMLLAVPATAAVPSQPDVDALLGRLDDLYRSKSSIARIEIKVTRPRATRTLGLRAWTRGEEEALVLIEAPPREAGTATLRVRENLWNYLPRIARTIRVPPSMMLGFLGRHRHLLHTLPDPIHVPTPLASKPFDPHVNRQRRCGWRAAAAFRRPGTEVLARDRPPANWSI